MNAPEASAWEIVQARDRALVATRKSYDAWIASLREQLDGTKKYLAEVEADRRARLKALDEAQANFNALTTKSGRADALKRLRNQLIEVEADREARLLVIEKMQAELDVQGQRRHEAEATAKRLGEELEGTRKHLTAVEADSAARFAALEGMQRTLEEQGAARQLAEGQAKQREEELVGTQAYLATIEADRANRLAAIQQMQAQLEEQGRAKHAAEARVADLEQSLAGTKEYLSSVERDREARLTAILDLQSQLEKEGAARHHAEAELRRLSDERNGANEYLATVEADRTERLKTIVFYQAKLTEAYADLERSTTDLTTRIAETRNLDQLMIEKDRELALLRGQLAAAANQLRDAQARLNLADPGRHQSQAESVQREFASFGRHIRNLYVAKYHERLLPQILQLSAAGVIVEVFESPKALSSGYQGTLRFLTMTAWEWLGAINSFFNEKAYLAANPDVMQGVNTGALRSGWEHFQLFGRHEGRRLEPDYCGGLAEFDAVAFDASDADAVVPALIGRLQGYQKILVSGFDANVRWLPPDAAQSLIGSNLLVRYRPPTEWLAQRVPTAALSPGGNWPRLRKRDLYPAKVDGSAAWPRITVVTVSYNQVQYLEETLRSVLDQEYPNLEYLVVDGGSTDGSVELIERYASKLTWWVSEQDNGQSQALNKGFKRATGEILTWLNSDDRLAPGSLFAIGKAFAQHQPDMVAGRCARVTGQEAMPYHIHRSTLPLGYPTTLPLNRLLDLEGEWMKGSFFHQPEVFFSRRIFERSGGALREDLYYSMDYDLWVRMAKAGATILAIPEIVAIFRQHEKQKTGGDNLPFLPELREVNAAHRLERQSTPAFPQ